MDLPEVSVIIPTYKHEAYVLDALESVFAQSFRNVEVIVVNDGSPDGTSELLRPLHEAGRIRLIEQENQGQAAARSRGLAEAMGEFIALLDDDDAFEPEKIAWQTEMLRSHPEAALVWGQVHDMKGEPLPHYCHPDPRSDWTAQEFFYDNKILSPGQGIFRRKALEAVGGFDPRFKGADDWDLYLRLLQNAKFVYHPAPALRYRFHTGNASNRAIPVYRDILSVYRKHYWTYRKRWSPDLLIGTKCLRRATAMRLIALSREAGNPGAFCRAILPLLFFWPIGIPIAFLLRTRFAPRRVRMAFGKPL